MSTSTSEHTQSPLDRIRAAERLMRERAEYGQDCNPGPWRTQREGQWEWSVRDADGDSITWTAPDYVASWHPLVALAVSDMLRQAAMDLWAHGPLCCADGCDECDDALWMPYARRALAAADYYLGLADVAGDDKPST